MDALTKTDQAYLPVGRITADCAAVKVAAHGFEYSDAIEVIEMRATLAGFVDGLSVDAGLPPPPHRQLTAPPEDG